MKSIHIRLALFSMAILLGSCAARTQAAYVAGDIVTNDLVMQTRLRWTNDNGQVFTPSNTVVRLSDFDGKIVFYCMWDVW